MGVKGNGSWNDHYIYQLRKRSSSVVSALASGARGPRLNPRS